MNLHNIAAQYVASVNPWISVSIRPSTGWTTGSDGIRVPSYGSTVTMSGQLQSLSYQDLRQLDGLNIQGVRRALYLNGEWPAVVRPQGVGGDLVTLPDQTVWLVAQVLEDWNITSGWTKLCITLQNNQ
jgi:hypothetical protein